jgi:hypothetical protein
MKIPLAFCLKCGWVTQDLDELDAHTTVNCEPWDFTPTPDVARQFPCKCGAKEGQHCVSDSGRIVSAGGEHSNRWDQVRELTQWTRENNQ